MRTLFEETTIDLRVIFGRISNRTYPSPVREEFEYFGLYDFFQKDNFYIVPINESELNRFTNKNLTSISFDLADQTLLLSGQRDSGTILTDDYDLMLEAYALKINVLRLPAFLIFLLKNNQIEKKIVNIALRYWTKTH